MFQKLRIMALMMQLNTNKDCEVRFCSHKSFFRSKQMWQVRNKNASNAKNYNPHLFHSSCQNRLLHKCRHSCQEAHQHRYHCWHKVQTDRHQLYLLNSVSEKLFQEQEQLWTQHTSAAANHQRQSQVS